MPRRGAASLEASTWIPSSIRAQQTTGKSIPAGSADNVGKGSPYDGCAGWLGLSTGLDIIAARRDILWYRGPTVSGVPLSEGGDAKSAVGLGKRKMGDSTEFEKLKEDAREEFSDILDELSRDHPKIVEGSAALVSGALGGSASLTALYLGGSVTGLSAAGITSGLAAAGAIVGGGMVAGVAVLAAPVAVLAVGGYAIAKRRRNAKLAAALRTAIEKLHGIQERLTANAEYFTAELAEIKAYIDSFERQMPQDGKRS